MWTVIVQDQCGEWYAYPGFRSKCEGARWAEKVIPGRTWHVAQEIKPEENDEQP